MNKVKIKILSKGTHKAKIIDIARKKERANLICAIKLHFSEFGFDRVFNIFENYTDPSNPVVQFVKATLVENLGDHSREVEVNLDDLIGKEALVTLEYHETQAGNLFLNITRVEQIAKKGKSKSRFGRRGESQKLQESYDEDDDYDTEVDDEDMEELDREEEELEDDDYGTDGEDDEEEDDDYGIDGEDDEEEDDDYGIDEEDDEEEEED